MKNKNKRIIALTVQRKRIYVSGGVFVIPKSTVIKYPVLFASLINRIKYLQSRYHRDFAILLFDLENNRSKAAQTLQSLGGVYILWCRENGMFYVGSALRYFSNKGRLTDYFMPNRVKSSLDGSSSKVSIDLAKAISDYGIESFTLLAVDYQSSVNLDKTSLSILEQF